MPTTRRLTYLLRQILTGRVTLASYWRAATKRSARALLRRGYGRQLACVATGLLITIRDRQLTRVTFEESTQGFYTRAGGRVMGATTASLASPRTCSQFLVEHFLRHYRVQPGDVVVELGAGTGTETVGLASMVGPTGLVLAVEANPRVARVLQRTIEAGPPGSVKTQVLAVADTPGSLRIVDEVDHVGSHLDIGGPPQAVSVEVPAITLDDLVQLHGLSRIDLLKINIEGAELPALSAATQALAITRNVVVSCHDFKARRTGVKFFQTKAAVQQILEQRGLEILPGLSSGPGWRTDTVYARRVVAPDAN